MTDKEFYEELDRRVKEDDSALMKLARNELGLIIDKCDDDESRYMQEVMNRGILRCVYIFVAEDHSGFTAGYAINAINKLLRYEPLTRRKEVTDD